MKSLIDCLLIPGYFDEKYPKVDTNSMSYGIFTNSKFFFDALCPVIATFVNAFTELFNNFFFLIRKTRLHSWYHLRTFWCTLEIFGDDRHFDLLLQLCCPFLFWSFTPNTEGTEIRIFECSSKRMHRWEKKKMKPLHCKTVLDAYFSRDSFIQMIAMKMESSFTTLIASRGWYQKSTWKDEALSFKKETDPVALRFDPFSIAFSRKSIEYLTPLTVGHILLERSWFACFFLERGGKMEAKVYRRNWEESPIPIGGLEIVAQVTFKIEEKKCFLLRLVDLIVEN